MLCDLVERAQRGEEAPMVELIQKFSDLFKKYARKLNYEDAYQDIVVFFIEIIKSFKLEKLQCKKDEIIVSYINVSIINFYKKSIGKLITVGKEIVLSDLSEEQAYYVDVQMAKEDAKDIFMELGMKNVLNENEYRVIYLIYSQGYTTAEIARTSNKSRQAVNQLKHRALIKIKNSLQECS